MIQYFWQIIYAHTIAYFVAGVFALLVMNYRDLFATDVISSFMKPVDEPIVVLGPVLQIFRGILLALVLLPLRKVFFEEKNGLMKLGVIILGLSLLSTIGPTMGSFEGYIYTKIPYMYQMLGYPEAILYVLLFYRDIACLDKICSQENNHLVIYIDNGVDMLFGDNELCDGVTYLK